jgi:hypothetical protein
MAEAKIGSFYVGTSTPTAFYSDKHSVFRVNKPNAKGGSGMTQFGCALAQLNIEIICANSSHAKGRVERANRTLQDRLVKELRLAGIRDMAAGNAFLPEFLERFNKRFAVRAAKQDDLHRRLTVCSERLARAAPCVSATEPGIIATERRFRTFPPYDCYEQFNFAGIRIFELCTNNEMVGAQGLEPWTSTV